MRDWQIVFTAPNQAELLEREVSLPGQEEVLLRTLYTAVSAGTERANLIGEININPDPAKCNDAFPRELGYSGVGIVEAVGARVHGVQPGDRAVIYFGKHRAYNLVSENKVFRVPSTVTSEDAALCTIACFPLEGLRKTRLEIGESAAIVGLGLLGLMAVQMCAAAGAVPVIAVDPNPHRRKLALAMGATCAFDPSDRDFVESVRAATDERGVDVIIEASGEGAALKEALKCVARFGRISLLGCTRKNIDDFDVYHLVHSPGIQIIGAHNNARPKFESRPGNWTYQDDIRAILSLLAHERLNFRPLISEIHSPEECKAQYERLALRPTEFPIGMLFDWDRLEGKEGSSHKDR